MGDAALRRTCWDSVAHQQRLFGTHAAGGRVVEGDGFVASVVPDAPETSLLNAAVPLDPDRPPALADLARTFAGAGVRWGVWIDDGGRDAEGELFLGGLRVEGSWRVMGARLGDLDPRPDPRVRPADPVTVGAVNDLAYGLGDGRLERHFGALPATVVHGHRIDHGPGAAAVAAVIDHGDDAGVLFVATIASARRRGLAAAVMASALHAAAARGRTTSTLLATPAGTPLYVRMGYRDLGEARMWSRPA